MTYYLDYDTGRLYLSAARSQLVDTLSAKYGDTITLRLIVLDAAGNPRDIGTDVLRLGARIGGTQALLVDGARYTPTVSGAVVSPSYEMDIPINTTPIKAALVNRDYVHLTAELERETIAGRHVSSQTIMLHVEPDIVDINDVPDVAPGIPAATEAWVRQLADGLTAGTIPGFDVASTTMLPPGSPATTTLSRDAETGLYKFAFLLPATPGERGVDGASAYALAVAHGYSGTEAQWLESLKGAYVAKGATYRPSTSVNGYTLTLSWTNDGGLTNPPQQQIVIPPGATGPKGDPGPKGDTGTPGGQGDTGPQGAPGIVPPIDIGDVRSGSEASVWMDYDEEMGYTINLSLPRGDTGMSAYEQAVVHGYRGTEAQWLESLKGPKGDPGDVSADQLATKLDKPSNSGSVGQVLVKDDHGSHWGVGGGDVTKDGNNVMSGNNTFTGQILLAPAPEASGFSLSSTQSTEEAFDGPPRYIVIQSTGAATFLDILVADDTYDTDAKGGYQDNVRLITPNFAVSDHNRYGLVNVGRLMAYAVPLPEEAGESGRVITWTPTGTEWSSVSWQGGVVDNPVTLAAGLSIVDERDSEWPWAKFDSSARSLQISSVNAVPPNIEDMTQMDTSIMAHAMMSSYGRDSEARVGLSSDHYGGPACYLSITTQSADAELVTPASGSLVCAPLEAQERAPCPLKMRVGQSDGTAYNDNWLLSPDCVTNVAMVEAMVVGKVIYADRQEFQTLSAITLPAGTYEIRLTNYDPMAQDLTTLLPDHDSVVRYIAGTAWLNDGGIILNAISPSSWESWDGSHAGVVDYPRMAVNYQIMMIVSSTTDIHMARLFDRASFNWTSAVSYCIRTA